MEAATHECEQYDAIDEIKKDVKSICKIINGNGEPGLAAKVHKHEEFINKYNTSKNGLLDWAFRGLIACSLAYIAHKVGLK